MNKSRQVRATTVNTASGKIVNRVAHTDKREAAKPKQVELKIVKLPIGQVRADPEQHRKDFDKGYIDGLAASIQKVGLQTPVHVVALKTPEGGVKYQIVSGECRLRACRQLKLKVIPAIVWPAGTPKQRILDMQIVENIARKQVNPMEEANAYRQMADEFMRGAKKTKRFAGKDFKDPAVQARLEDAARDYVSETTGQTRTKVSYYIKLTDLDPEVQEMVAKGHLTPKHGNDLTRFTDGITDPKELRARRTLQVNAARYFRAQGVNAASASAIITERLGQLAQQSMFDEQEISGGEKQVARREQKAKIDKAMSGVVAMIAEAFSEKAGGFKPEFLTAGDLQVNLQKVTGAINTLAEIADLMRKRSAQLEAVEATKRRVSVPSGGPGAGLTTQQPEVAGVSLFDSLEKALVALGERRDVLAAETVTRWGSEGILLKARTVKTHVRQLPTGQLSLIPEHTDKRDPAAANVIAPASQDTPAEEMPMDTYAKRVVANMKHMNAQNDTWLALEIKSLREETTKSGATVALPIYEVPEGYTAAPTLYNGDAAGVACCELCGKAPVKTLYTIINPDKKWTLGVGSECVTHFQEASGEQMARAKRQSDKQQAFLDAREMSKTMARTFSKEGKLSRQIDELAWRLWDDLRAAGRKVTLLGADTDNEKQADTDREVQAAYRKYGGYIEDLLAVANKVLAGDRDVVIPLSPEAQKAQEQCDAVRVQIITEAQRLIKEKGHAPYGMDRFAARYADAAPEAVVMPRNELYDLGYKVNSFRNQEGLKRIPLDRLLKAVTPVKSLRTRLQDGIQSLLLKAHFTPEEMKHLKLRWVTSSRNHEPIIVKDLGDDEAMVVGGAGGKLNYTRFKLKSEGDAVKPKAKKDEPPLSDEQKAALEEQQGKNKSAVDEKKKALAETIQQHLGEKYGELSAARKAAVEKQARAKAEKLGATPEETEDLVRAAAKEQDMADKADAKKTAEQVARAAIQAQAREAATGIPQETEITVAGNTIRLTAEQALEIAEKSMELRQVQADARAVTKALKRGDQKVQRAVDLLTTPATPAQVKQWCSQEEVDRVAIETNAKLAELADPNKPMFANAMAQGAVEAATGMALDVAGETILRPDTATKLGITGTARVIAHYLAQKHDPAKMKDAIQAHLATRGGAVAAAAVAETDGFIQQAEAIRATGGAGGMLNKVQADRMADNLIQEARRSCSRALGGLETMAQAAQMLDQGVGGDLLIPGKATRLGCVQQGHDLGLSSDEFSVVKGEGGKLNLKIKESALDKLANPQTQEEWQGEQEIQDIKARGRGEGWADEKDPTQAWKPEGVNEGIQLSAGQQADVKLLERQKGMLITSEAGTGKCLNGDTLVLVNGQPTRIDDYVNGKLGSDAAISSGEVARRISGDTVISVDEQGHFVTSEVGGVFKQRIQEALVNVRLASGRFVEVTKAHPLLIMRDGEMRWTPAGQLAVGDHVATPAKLPVSERVTPGVEIAELIAWQLAEGNEYEVCARFHNAERLVLDRFSELVQLAGFTPKEFQYGEKCPYIQTSGRQYRRWLESLDYPWGTHSKGRRLPSWVFVASEDTRRRVVETLYNAEGSVNPQRGSVELTTASPELCNQLAYLLLQFGVVGRIYRKMKCATNGSRIKREYWEIQVNGENRVRFEQAFTLMPRKQAKFAECPQNVNPNVGLYPIRGMFTDIVDSLRVGMRPVGGIGASRYYHQKRDFSRTELGVLIERLLGLAQTPQMAVVGAGDAVPLKITEIRHNALAMMDRSAAQVHGERLQGLLEADLVFDPVQSITEAYTDFVYDLIVPQHHNFVGGFGGMVLHNTGSIFASAANLITSGKVKRVLIVVPLSVYSQMVGSKDKPGEAAKFLTPELAAQVKGVASDSGMARSARKAAYASDAQIVITNHDALRTDFGYMRDQDWGAVMCDEVQDLSEREGRKTSIKAENLRALKPEYRMLLSATPIKNDLSELHSLVDYIQPGSLGTQKEFMARYGKLGQGVGVMDQALLQSLQRKLDTCATGIRLTTKKTVGGKEVLELKRVDDPTKAITCAQTEVRTKLSPEQVKGVRATEDNFLAMKRDGTLPKGAAFQKRDAQKKIINNGDPATNSKVAEVKKLIAASPGKKFIVFATNKYAIDTLTAGLGLPKNQTRLIDSSVNSKKRVAIAEEMTDDPDIRVLSCTDAANAGLNITGATEVIMFDTSDTPAIVEQRYRRSFRRGQTQDVKVHHLRSDAPVEMSAERGLKRKGKSMTTVERLTIADEHGHAGTLREYLDGADGGEKLEKSRRVSAHSRIVNGKIVFVAEHEDKRDAVLEGVWDDQFAKAVIVDGRVIRGIDCNAKRPIETVAADDRRTPGRTRRPSIGISQENMRRDSETDPTGENGARERRVCCPDIRPKTGSGLQPVSAIVGVVGGRGIDEASFSDASTGRGLLNEEFRKGLFQTAGNSASSEHFGDTAQCGGQAVCADGFDGGRMADGHQRGGDTGRDFVGLRARLAQAIADRLSGKVA